MYAEGKNCIYFSYFNFVYGKNQLINGGCINANNTLLKNNYYKEPKK